MILRRKMSEIKLKEYCGVKIVVDNFTGTFRARIGDKDLAYSELYKMEEAISMLSKTEAAQEECYVYDYMYKMVKGKILRFDTDYVTVKVDKGYKEESREKHDRVFPKTAHNDKIFNKIEELKRLKLEQERKYDDLISVELKTINHFATDYFTKKALKGMMSKLQVK
jgi:hypothetical protein